jgi:Transposase DDE domain/Domain of unknown function (DUF4372)
MVKSVSLFSQILHHIPRHQFAALVKTHRAEYQAKGFTCWSQLVSMLFCHLAHADSLREICHGLRSTLGRLRHLGVFREPNKSTLAYANQHRPAELYRDLFFTLLSQFSQRGALGHRPAKFRFKNPLLSLDSTTITLCLELFEWANYRTAKGGVKVHTLLDHDVYMPVFAHITTAREHDIKTARRLHLTPGSIVAMDRAYVNYSLLHDWTQRGIFFVTRLKANAAYKIVQRLELPERRKILADEIIQFTGPQTAPKCPIPLRRVVVWDEEHQREIVLLTNHLKFGATTISSIYKERWQIELFFKAFKQTLKVKTFVGTSKNALAIQIWTALIAMLLLKWMHHLSQLTWSFSNLAALLRINLFTHRDLTEWLRNPFQDEPEALGSPQLRLPWATLGQP